MKNKTLIIAIGLIVVVGIIFWITRSSDKSVTPIISPIPDTTAQKEFDNTTVSLDKIKTQAIEAVKLPDHVTSRFEKISNGKLGLLGNDQTIYVIDLASKEQKTFNIPDSLLEEEATFATYNDDFSQAIVGFGANNKVLYADLISSQSTILDLDNPVEALFADEAYVFSGTKTLKISTIQSSKLVDYKDTQLSPVKMKTLFFGNKIILANKEGIFSISKSIDKISSANTMTLGSNSSTLAIDSNDKNIEIFNQDLGKTKNLAADYKMSEIYIDSSQNIYVAATYSEDANDKLIKFDQAGSQQEIAFPDQYPDFLREFRIDQILSINGSEIYYSDQGNIFKIIL
jgi:hypothetical protein